MAPMETSKDHLLINVKEELGNTRFYVYSCVWSRDSSRIRMIVKFSRTEEKAKLVQYLMSGLATCHLSYANKKMLTFDNHWLNHF